MCRLFLIIAFVSCANILFAQKVTNVTASQEGNFIRVYYSLESNVPCEVSLHISADDGKTWSEALRQVTGDAGPGISSGQRSILWDVLTEREKLVGNAKFKVVTVSRKPYEPEMVFVEGGTFQMGSESGQDDEQPVHEVKLSSFYIGKYEVTQAQWREVMGSNPSDFANCDQCPVEQVSWNDVQDYIEKLNAKTGKQYRLPTEAEWEFAARGGNQSKGYTYSGSNDLNSVAWYAANAQGKTHPVGQKQANELGIYDMCGNVSEYCNDKYGDNNTSTIKDVGPWVGVLYLFHVLRGPCIYDSEVRSFSYFAWGELNNGGHQYGFRLISSPSSPGQ